MTKTRQTADEVRRHQRRAYFFVCGVIVVIGLVAAFVLERVTASYWLADQRKSHQLTADGIQSRAEARLQAYQSMAQNLAIFMGYERGPQGAQFSSLAGVLSRDNPSIINIALAEDFIITRVYPLGPNRAALGLDLRTRPSQIADIRKMIAADMPIVSGPVDLVQGGSGLIVRAAGAGRTPNVYALVLDLDAFFAEVGFDLTQTSFSAALREISARESVTKTLLGNPDIWSGDPVVANIRINDERVVQVGLVPVNSWSVQSPYRLGILIVISTLVLIGFGGANYARHLIQERANARRQLVAAIESIEDGFVVYDSDDRLLLCNEKYRSYYRESADLFVPGATFESIIRRGVARGQYVEAAGREEEWIQERLADHADPKGAVEQQLPNGKWLRIAESKTADGYTVGLRIDVSELKSALHKAEEAAVAKTDFLNNVSHELRTPLSIVLGYVAFLKNVTILPRFKDLSDAVGDTQPAREKLDAFAAEIAKQAERTDRSGRHLMGLINSILDWATISVGQVELEYTDVDLGAMLKNLTEELSVSAKEKGLNLISMPTDCVIQADELRMRQIFINLIANAIKFTEKGHVRVEAVDQGETVLIVVEDTGPGIPPDRLSAIFERFGQADGSTKRKYGGAGLGLAICKSLVEHHGGVITVESVFGEGSKFLVILPKEAAPAQVQVPPAQRDAA